MSAAVRMVGEEDRTLVGEEQEYAFLVRLIQESETQWRQWLLTGSHNQDVLLQMDFWDLVELPSVRRILQGRIQLPGVDIGLVHKTRQLMAYFSMVPY